MASHHKQVAVVAESIHCLGHETEHYYNSILARTTCRYIVAPETEKTIFYEKKNNNLNYMINI